MSKLSSPIANKSYFISLRCRGSYSRSKFAELALNLLVAWFIAPSRKLDLGSEVTEEKRSDQDLFGRSNYLERKSVSFDSKMISWSLRSRLQLSFN